MVALRGTSGKGMGGRTEGGQRRTGGGEHGEKGSQQGVEERGTTGRKARDEQPLSGRPAATAARRSRRRRRASRAPLQQQQPRALRPRLPPPLLLLLRQCGSPAAACAARQKGGQGQRDQCGNIRTRVGHLSIQGKLVAGAAMEHRQRSTACWTLPLLPDAVLHDLVHTETKRCRTSTWHFACNLRIIDPSARCQHTFGFSLQMT